MTKKKSLPNQKEFRKSLGECSFNPRELTGPIKVIIENGNTYYFMTRAKELIDEAKLTTNIPDQISKIKLSISLLGYAKLLLEKEPGLKIKDTKSEE